MVTAVLHDGEVEIRGHGTDAAGRPVDGDTPFRIATMSKSFTATLVALLAERGVLDLDAPLTEALPGFVMDDGRAERITLRMLLSHTSGIGGGSTRDLGRPTNADPAALLADLRDESLAADPGTEHVYSNTGYALAAGAVQRATGREFDEVLRDELLEPLGMTDTVAVADCAAPVQGVGSGHTVVFGRVLPFPEPADNCLGSDGVESTADDLAAWLAFQSGDGAEGADDGAEGAGDERPLGDRMLRDLHAAQPGTQDVDGYGLGWSFAEQGGVDFLEHGGALVTWASHMAIVRGPDGQPTGDAAVVLTDTAGTPALLARTLAADAAGATVPVPERPLIGPALVFGGLGALVVLAGLIGLARSRSWPRRRRAVAGRTAGLAWPVVLVALCAALPWLLARYLYGSALDVPTAWHWGAGMLPEAILVIALAGMLCAAVAVARVVALRR